MKVIFPNPFGGEPLPADQVARLADTFRFSDDYAEFLRVQNGFDVRDMESSDGRDTYLAAHSPQEPSGESLAQLYAVGTGDSFNDLEILNAGTCNVFEGIFFLIGSGAGGEDWVEVLAGKNRGRIACLNPEVGPFDSLDDFLVSWELDDLVGASAAQVADALEDEDLDVVMGFYADRFSDFVAEGIHWSQTHGGVVVDVTGRHDSAGS